MSVKQKLMEEFNSQIEGLHKMELGTDKYKVTVDGVTKLADRIVEIQKAEDESVFKNNTQTNECILKEEQLKADKRDRVIKNCITVGSAVLSAAVYGAAFIASTNFEREGTFTTEGGKSSIRQLLKLKF